MTNFDDRFRPNAGSWLGVPYPIGSASLQSGYNVTFTTGGGTDFPFVLGKEISVPDTIYAGIVLPVANLGASTFMARGKRPDGSADWSKQFGATINGRSTGSYYMDEASGKLYVMASAVASNNIQFITEIDMILGTVVSKIALATGVTSVNADHSYHLRPVTPGSPSTSDWQIIHGYGAGNTVAMSEIAIGNTITTDKQDLKVDSGGTNQSFGFRPQYMSDDKKIIIGDWLAAGSSTGGAFLQSPHISFNIQRGPMQRNVLVPFDTNLPMPSTTANLVSSTAIDTSANALRTAWITTDVSVIFVADLATSATNSWAQVWGRRVFDKVDFDRWLSEICDALDMPAGEAFY